MVVAVIQEPFSSTRWCRLGKRVSAKLFHYGLSIVSNFRDCSCDFFFAFLKLLDPLLRDFGVRKIDSTSVGLGRTDQRRHGLRVVREQGE